MELRWLEAFVAVAEELHFGRAAARLATSQSPLSQTIKKLEKDVDTRLFERNTRRVELTAGGHALLPHAYKVLEEVDAARRATQHSAGGVYGTVRVGFAGVLNHRALPPLTRALRRRCPNVALTLTGSMMTRDVVQQIEHGAMDLGFVGLPVRSDSVSTRLIRREPFGVVLPQDHRLAGEAVISLADLADDAFITTPQIGGSSLHELGMRACLEAGFRPRIIQEITDPYMILMLVASGVGVALMPDGLLELMPSGAVFVRVADARVEMSHGIAWPSARTSDALAAVLTVADDVLPSPD